MQGEWSYIKSFNNISSNTILVTADGVGSYPSIAHEFGLNAIKEALHNRERKSILTEDILKMLEFVMKNNYFEFNGKIKQRLLGTTIGTKCAPPYQYIFIDKVEIDFLGSRKPKSMVWFCYANDIFFFWTLGESSSLKNLAEPIQTLILHISLARKRFHSWIYL